MVLVGLTVALCSRAARAADGLPADQMQVGTWATTPDFERYLHSLRPGDTIRFSADGHSYVGTYAGEHVIDGVTKHVAVNLREFEPGDAEAKPGTRPVSPATGDHSTDAGSGGKGSSGAGSNVAAAAGYAAGTQVVYRLVFVSPQLEHELAVAEAELDAAHAAHTAAVEQYTLTVETKVAHAADALHALQSAIGAGDVHPMSIIVQKRNDSIQFNTADLTMQTRMANAYYTAINAPIPSPVHQLAQNMCLAGLNVANEGGASTTTNADTLVAVSEKFAKFLRSSADLLLGIDPVTGLVRDTYEMVSGTNLVTGEVLSDNERAVRAIMAGVNLATLGVVETVEGGFRNLAKVIQRGGGDGAKGVEKVLVVVEGLPFTKHGMERFTERRLTMMVKAENGAELTPEWIRTTIDESTPYWDRAQETIAFHSEHAKGDWWLRVAIDRNEESTIVTVIPNNKPFNLPGEFMGGPRFVPYEEKVPDLLKLK
jgi:hypothetical protein